jgi:hypothetical protein
MSSIRTLESLSREDIREMAHAAADRDDQHANPFEPGSANHRRYEHDYQERSLELCDA